MTTLDSRVHFLTDFARRLHLAGVSAARLEGAVKSTAQAIGVACEIWSSPTGILLSMADAGDPEVDPLDLLARVVPEVVAVERLVLVVEGGRDGIRVVLVDVPVGGGDPHLVGRAVDGLLEGTGSEGEQDGERDEGWKLSHSTPPRCLRAAYGALPYSSTAAP